VRYCDLAHSDAEVYADAWSEVLDRPARRVLAYVPERYFDLEYPEAKERLRVGLFGSVQPHNGQLEAVEAIGMLKRNGAEVALRLFGYEHFNPAYLAECKGLVEKHGLAGLVDFCGFAEDRAEAMRELDAVLCASDRGAIPEELPEAMAAGRLALAPASGGMAELISRRTGIPMADRSAASIAQAVDSARTMTGAERREKAGRARETAKLACSKYPVARELFRLYREAIDEHGPVREAVGEVNGKYPPVRPRRFARLLQSARGAWGVK
jgi:glycosyltransferase involved in cell wall biosynthesis